MAGSEGVGQTELLSGWSCVVHRPSEDPEPSELPSTVDMAAFSGGLSVEPANPTHPEDNSDSDSDSEADSTNTGSDASQSNSQSESSDTDSSSSSQDSTSRSPSPEFSVTSSQTNVLRLTIATVRKSCSSPTEKTTKSNENGEKNTSLKNGDLISSSDTDSESSDTDDPASAKSDIASCKKSAKDSGGKKSVIKVRNKTLDKKTEKRTVKKDLCASPKPTRIKSKHKKNRKMASLPLSRGSTCSNSDSDDSDADSAMLASCSLQEIRQEDLAAILPDQQECDAFGGFECRNDKNSPQAGDASGSDMELPQQAVNALIQRTTESSSESESHPPPNPNTLYANSLLQQFVAQTQLLNNTPCAIAPSASETTMPATASNIDVPSNATSESENKRKRGRPRKSNTQKPDDTKNLPKPVLNNSEYCGDPNVSPDSGIQNSPDHVSSPDCSPLPSVKTNRKGESSKKNNNHKSTELNKNAQLNKNTNNSNNLTSRLKEQNKLPVTSNRFDRLLYGNADRVLYPPRRKVGRPPVTRKGPGRPPKYKPSAHTETKPPDKNMHGKVSPLSKTEKPSKSKKLRDKDIIQLATNTNNLHLGKNDTNESNKKPRSLVLHDICERVSKRLEFNNKSSIKVQANNKNDSNITDKHSNKSKKMCKNHRTILATKNKNDRIKVKYTTLKNAKLMHSRHKKHKKYKFKILKPVTATVFDPKINAEIDKLIIDFVKYCNITSNKVAKENVPDVLKVLKKVSKKRKASEHNERKKKKQNTANAQTKETNSNEQRLPLKKRHYHLSTNNESKESESTMENNLDENKMKTDKIKPMNSNKIPANTVGNVTHKSPQNTKCSPVIKTNYIGKMSSLNNNDYEISNDDSEFVATHIDEAIEACITRYSSTNPKSKYEEISPAKEEKPITATTPKKRHRLEAITEIDKLNIKTEGSILYEPDSSNTKAKSRNSLENVVSELKLKKNLSPKNEKKNETIAQINTRKKNRLEDLTSTLVSKISTTPEKKKDDINRASVIKYPVCKKSKPVDNDKLDFIDAKPTGIFMPTVDIELHIPTNTIFTNHYNDINKNPKESDEIDVKNEDLKQDISVKQTVDITRKKMRKRRAINRTGFPTVKKKKKKLLTESSLTLVENETKTLESTNDRVPQSGEEYTKFLQRTESCSVSVVAIERLQKPAAVAQVNEEEIMSRWEVMSECDSLPQEERIEFESDESKIDLKHDRRTLRPRDVSPATSVDTKSSRHKSDMEDSKYKLEDRVKRKRIKKPDEIVRHCMQKRKMRDISPASSIDPLGEKRIREDLGSGDESKKFKKIPRWRKKYLVAGLFSDYYKEDDEAARIKRNENISNKSRFMYKPEEHPYGLLPPPYHCGKYLRCRKLPFQLPFDLWWQHTHSQLPGRDIVPSWNYRKIRTNIYNVKITTGACEPQACNCSPTSGCGDDCINRLVLAECPANHKCQNQKIQKHEWAPGLEKFMTESKGWGVRTKESIKSGEFILEYVGEVVSDQEFKERMATRYVHDTHHYCLHLDGGLVIDGHRMGGDGRFVNHSCQPNCEMQKWSVNGQFRMALFALRNIEADEELTYDYNFSLFNPAEGQECKCGSDICRGVIGGKSQRVRQINQNNNTTNHQSGRVGRPRKNQAKRTTNGLKEQSIPVPTPILPTPQVKPMSHQQKCYVLEHHCFLLRNLSKVKKLREKSVGTTVVSKSQAVVQPIPKCQTTNQSTTFLNQLTVLQKPRNMKTRRLAQVEDDPELKKMAKLAKFLKDLFITVTNSKDENREQLAAPLMNLPSKRKFPDYYQRITEPIDFSMIDQNITNGLYRTIECFDNDMNKLFTNCVRYYGRTSEMGICATRLKKVYTESKQKSITTYEQIMGEKLPVGFLGKKNKGEEEDVIRCICGMFRDEGLMIQCERCLVWQHCECVKADPSAASYHCERCIPRSVDLEIPLDEYTEHGHRYYMTLMRGSLQLRQGDTVYVLRDIPIPGTDKKHTYSTIGEIKYSDLDIFRIERLWKDSKNGQRFAYGHHYLRPHETYHEPTRKFFPNEVMRVPLYEAVPVELIISHCWVMDLNTFCKGRPIGAPEEHIYICEYRVDKTARLFSKVSKNKFPICTKSYAFDRFDVRLKISRTYTPHDLDPALVKPRGRKPHENEDGREIPTNQIPLHVPVIRTRKERIARLNKILLNLLAKMPTKQALDVSYLLEGGRRRKKNN